MSSLTSLQTYPNCSLTSLQRYPASSSIETEDTFVMSPRSSLSISSSVELEGKSKMREANNDQCVATAIVASCTHKNVCHDLNTMTTDSEV